jgi:hypothetical protein
MDVPEPETLLSSTLNNDLKPPHSIGDPRAKCGPRKLLEWPSELP